MFKRGSTLPERKPITISPLNGHRLTITCPQDGSGRQMSCAKTASALMSLRCNAFITVMKATHLRDCDNPSGTRLPREGTLLVEPQMGSGLMVVTEIRSQGSLQMPRVQNDEMVQAVSSYRADRAFNIRILPGTPGRGCVCVVFPFAVERHEGPTEANGIGHASVAWPQQRVPSADRSNYNRLWWQYPSILCSCRRELRKLPSTKWFTILWPYGASRKHNPRSRKN